MKSLEVDPRDYHTKLKFNKDDIFNTDSYLSKSVLWSSHGISLWHWRYHLDKFKPTVAMQWGSVIDTLTTTPELADEMIITSPYDSYRSKEAREWRDEQLDDGKLILSDDDYEKAHRHAEILLSKHPVSSKIFSESKKQVILHGETKDGIKLKGLADLIPPKDFLCDLKMCANFTRSGIEKAIAEYGYHVQGGFYLILWNMMNPDDIRKRFIFIFQNPATGEVTLYELSSDEIICGQAMAQYLIDRLVRAYKKKYFPMLNGNEIPIISRPTWAQMEDETLLYGDHSLGGGQDA